MQHRSQHLQIPRQILQYVRQEILQILIDYGLQEFGYLNVLPENIFLSKGERNSRITT